METFLIGLSFFLASLCFTSPIPSFGRLRVNPAQGDRQSFQTNETVLITANGF